MQFPRWITPRFGLRSLLLAFVVLCLACGWVFVPAARQRMVLRHFEELRSSSPHPDPRAVTIAYQHLLQNFPGAQEESRYSYWMRHWFGDRSFGEVVAVQLDYTETTDDDLRHLALCTQLHTLTLGHTKVTDNGLLHVEPLQKLQLLVLSSTGVTDAGLRHLKNIPSLRQLQLENTQITDESVAILGSLSNLKELYIESTHIPEEGFQRLKAALSGCTISWEPAAD